MSNGDVRQRFCKDYHLPIQLTMDPYFDYFVDLYDPLFGTKQKLEWLNSMVDELGVDGFYSATYKFTDSIISAINSTPSYRYLQNEKLVAPNLNVSSENLYIDKSANHWFISIDQHQANFNAMRHYNDDMVLGFKCWEDLARSYTKYDYLVNSKRLRQVVFGNLLPTKQQTIQKQLMGPAVSRCAKNFGRDRLSSLSSDELIVSTTEQTVDSDIAIISDFVHPSFYRVQGFRLDVIKSPYMVKRYMDGSFEFRNVPAYFMAQTYKHFIGLPVNEMDRSFLCDGHVALFVNNLFE